MVGSSLGEEVAGTMSGGDDEFRPIIMCEWFFLQNVS